jgi:hypothetical protein
MNRKSSSVFRRPAFAVAAAIVAALVTFSRPARAEALDLAGLLEILDGAIFERLLPSGGTAFLGGCAVEVRPGFPTTELRFRRSATCKLDGTIVLGFLPLTASVRLVIYDTPQLEAIDADFTMRLRFRPTTLDWRLSNARVAFRLTPQSPRVERALTGQGTRVRNGRNFTAQGRFNLFDPATGQGQALLRNVENRVRTRQVCMLSGAALADPASGVLSACVAR